MEEKECKKMKAPAYEKLGDYFNVERNEFVFSIEEQPDVEEFEKIIEEKAIVVAECVLNTEENFPGQKKKDGSLKKQRELYKPGEEDYKGKKVDYIKVSEEWTDKENEWLYLITYNKRIVKIGMTISSLEDRYKSYSCGTTRAMEKGSCSTTNFIITECNFNAVRKGMKVEILGIKCPFEKKEIIRYGVTKICKMSSVRDQETMITECFRKRYNHKPVLCVQEGK